jgi:predicted Zn-ribbon and HTH transcriptional regulator
MAEHAGEDAAESGLDEGSAAEWAVERAAELDMQPHEFLERMMRAYRAIEDEQGDGAAFESREVEELRETVETLEADIDEMIADVRDRVIQVKREADAKAPADHTHEEFVGRLQALQQEIQAVSEEVEAVAGRLEGGFENFEEILEFLVDRADDQAADIETLGGAVVALRETLEQVSAREQARARADHLKKKGAKRGVRTAKCEDCGSKVDLGLLAEATCPTCDATFHDLDPDPGFFGRSVLETGTRPALEAPSDVPSADEVESVAAGEAGGIPDREDLLSGLGTEAGMEEEDG